MSYRAGIPKNVSHTSYRRTGRARLKNRRRIARVVAAIFIFFICVAALAWVARLDVLRIDSVYVEGVKVLSEKEVAARVSEVLGEKYLWLFPKNNFFLYPRRMIIGRLRESFPRIEAVDVYAPDARSIVVSIKERVPFALWCGQTAPDDTAPSDMAEADGIGESKDCFFIDKGGFVFALAPQFSGEVYVKMYGGVSGGTADNPKGGRFLLPDEFERISTFIALLAEEGLKTSVFAKRPNGEYFFVLHPSGSYERFILYTKAFSEPESYFNMFRLAFEAKRGAYDGQEFFSTLEYIDMRFDGKMYFKFRR